MENNNKHIISKYSNSEIGSHHWAATLLSFVMRVGEYLENHNHTPEESKHYSAWGTAMKERAVEINDYLHSLPDKEPSLTKHLSELQAENTVLKDSITGERMRVLTQLREEIENLQSVMVAAAEEIKEHWPAHCDEDGYGPANLMHRLERGIAANYPGYKPGAFRELREENERLKEGLMKIKAELFEPSSEGYIASIINDLLQI